MDESVTLLSTGKAVYSVFAWDVSICSDKKNKPPPFRFENVVRICYRGDGLGGCSGSGDGLGGCSSNGSSDSMPSSSSASTSVSGSGSRWNRIRRLLSDRFYLGEGCGLVKEGSTVLNGCGEEREEGTVIAVECVGKQWWNCLQNVPSTKWSVESHRYSDASPYTTSQNDGSASQSSFESDVVIFTVRNACDQLPSVPTNHPRPIPFSPLALPPIVVLVGVVKPGNVGTIFRTSFQSGGFGGCVLVGLGSCQGEGEGYKKNHRNCPVGTMKERDISYYSTCVSPLFPHHYYPSFRDFLQSVRREGTRDVVATVIGKEAKSVYSPEGKEALRGRERRGIYLVLGGEAEGLDEDVLRSFEEEVKLEEEKGEEVIIDDNNDDVDMSRKKKEMTPVVKRIGIPMVSGSLNVGVAFGVIVGVMGAEGMLPNE